jgi:general secretion pathway protein D
MGGGGYGGGGGGVIRLPSSLLNRPAAPVTGGAAAPVAGDQTGQLLGAQAVPQGPESGIRIVPDEMNNLILVQGTQQEWEVIRKTLQQLDFPPRQVLIDAKIYEVSLTGAFENGVSAVLRQRTNSNRKLTGGFTTAGVTTLTIGALVGNTRELAVLLSASQTEGKSKLLSAPSIIATDNIAASITVGQTIATLASQAVAAGAQQDGNSLFTNTVTNVQTGVTLNITPRVNASGIVTMVSDQEVSSPQPPTGPSASPSIDRRNVSTQVTVADGDTVAIGGIIQESNTYLRNRVPVLGKIPILGAAFGSTSNSTSKTELVILLTPRVIYDENELTTVSQELQSRLPALRQMIQDGPGSSAK